MDWDAFCTGTESTAAEKATCVKIYDDYNKSQQLLMAKTKGEESHNSNSFAFGFGIGAAVGTLSAAVGIFAIKSCSNKHAAVDHFRRL